jgi:hypothetical protein
MLTRDSWVWLLAFVGLLLSHLITAQAPPTEWSYMQWLQFLSTFLAGIVGWLSKGPLAGDKTPSQDRTTILGGLLSVYKKPEDKR